MWYRKAECETESRVGERLKSEEGRNTKKRGIVVVLAVDGAIYGHVSGFHCL